MKIAWHCRDSAGYGDIISPLCYAQNQGEINDTVVQLDMKWSFVKSQEHTPDHIASAIHRLLPFPNVILTHRYGCSPSKEDYNEPLKQISKLNQMHNVYFPFNKVDPTHEVVCTPLNNKESFETYVGGIRMWKQALSDDQWLSIVNKPNVHSIDYTTTVEDAINILTQCKFFQGYHGSCSWLARLIGVPMKIYTGKPNLTSYCFPWSAKTREDSLSLLKRSRILRYEYINDLRRARFKRTAGI